MPYSNPEKKREYMRKYNPKYYEKNKERHNLVERNVENKSRLREAKTEYIFNYFGNICPHCSGVEEGETKITIEVNPRFKPLSKAIAEHTWDEIKLMVMNEVLSLSCSLCKKYGAPAENH